MSPQKVKVHRRIRGVEPFFLIVLPFLVVIAVGATYVQKRAHTTPAAAWEPRQDDPRTSADPLLAKVARGQLRSHVAGRIAGSGVENAGGKQKNGQSLKSVYRLTVCSTDMHGMNNVYSLSLVCAIVNGIVSHDLDGTSVNRSNVKQNEVDFLICNHNTGSCMYVQNKARIQGTQFR
nr:hypothetical protein CFP56_42063 [Quercus suber]